jgi:ribosome maturation factor RimP
MERTQLTEIINACVEKSAAHLINLVVRGKAGRLSIEVFVDSQAGVTTELCSGISREISRSLGGGMNRPYSLVVSSPGAGRSLKFSWQYAKHIGRKLRLTLRSADGTTHEEGTLRSVDDSGVVFETDNGISRANFDSIIAAVVKTPW